MRRQIWETVSAPDRSTEWSTRYDCFMILVIILSLIPLNFKEETLAFELLDKICAGIFIVDYLLRWMTADYGSRKPPLLAFLLYPFTFMAVIDLVSILPSLTDLSESLKMLRLFRMFRALRVLRVAKAVRYSRNLQIINNVIKRSRKPLAAVGTLALAYVYISALLMFNVEPETFDTMYDAIYWAMVSLTTVGYGDIYAVSGVGRAISMISSFLGIAIIALPAGIITAGYMEEISKPDPEGDEMTPADACGRIRADMDLVQKKGKVE